jgi:hypothetical protein
MEFSASHHYDAEPAAVLAMFNDPTFWQTLVNRAGATSSTVTPIADGVQVHVEVDPPDKARAFVGASLGLDQTFVWQAGADNSWTGDFEQKAAGKLPARSAGTATMKPGVTGGTDVDYRGEFIVSIPVMGRRLEAMAGPYVTRVIDLQQSVGQEWLSSH